MMRRTRSVGLWIIYVEIPLEPQLNDCSYAKNSTGDRCTAIVFFRDSQEASTGKTQGQALCAATFVNLDGTP